MANVRQRLAVSKLRETGGNISRARKLAGYKNPKNTEQLTQSKAWPELLEEFMPDILLAERNQWLIKHTNPQAVSAGLDKAYKIKKKYPDEPSGNTTVNVYMSLTEEQLQALIKKANDV